MTTTATRPYADRKLTDLRAEARDRLDADDDRRTTVARMKKADLIDLLDGLDAADDTPGDQVTATGAIVPQGVRTPRIPTGVDVWTCEGACGQELPVRKFPTDGRGHGRLVECRGCRDARYAKQRAKS